MQGFSLVWVIEMIKIKDAWYIALPSKKLGKRPVQRTVEGESIVFFRDDEGKACALLDRCLHRGMLLSEGRVEKGCIECPYHGWKYDRDGRIVDVPSLFDTRDRSSCHANRSYPTCEQDDHIWVWMGKSKPSCKPFHFPRYGEKGWRSFFMHTRFQAPVETCLENFLDVPHTIFVHPSLFRKNKPAPVKVRVTRKRQSVLAEFIDEPILQGIGPRICLFGQRKMRHTDQFILPSISRVDYDFDDGCSFIITSQCTQVSEMMIDVTTAITWRLRVPSIVAHIFLRPYCRMVINQDVRLLNKLGRQIHRFGVIKLDTPADLLSSHIAALRIAAVNGEQLPEMDSYETILRI